MLDTSQLDSELKVLESKFKAFDRPSLTREIKLLFSKLFENEMGCFRYANGIKDPSYQLINGDNEFVFDLVVVKEEKHGNGLVNEDFITDILLALESELDDSLHAVVVDFQKLLLCNADEKVIVFKCHSTEYDTWCDYLKLCISKYRKSQGTFHFIARLNDTMEFKRKTLKVGH